jgi:hypothetical protein
MATHHQYAKHQLCASPKTNLHDKHQSHTQTKKMSAAPTIKRFLPSMRMRYEMKFQIWKQNSAHYLMVEMIVIKSAFDILLSHTIFSTKTMIFS